MVQINHDFVMLNFLKTLKILLIFLFKSNNLSLQITYWILSKQCGATTARYGVTRKVKDKEENNGIPD